ncbi:MAG: hypothetical protein WHT27_01030 [candidate division WOR-3 bacterium]|jgi:hypothetical protein
MIKILENFFLKKRVKSIGTEWKKQINTSTLFYGIKNVVVIWNNEITSLNSFLTFDRSLKNKLKNVNIYYLIFPYFTLYKDFFNQENIEELIIPKPIKFQELEKMVEFKKKVKEIDLFIDLSNIEKDYRKLFIRTLQPSVSITFFEVGIEEDFNILFKSKDKDPVNLLKLLNFDIVDENFLEYLKIRIEKLNITVFPLVLIGQSSKVLKEKKKAEKEGKRFLYISSLKNELNIVNFYHILKTQELIFDENVSNEVTFIKSLKF